MTAATPATPATFDQPDLLAWLEAADDAALDALDVGVIGFDGQAQVCRYNATESRATGLHPGRVVGHPLFTDIAQCMNNYLVAQRFEDAAESGQPLDTSLDYVFTWRMRPVPVRLRLLARPGAATRYVVVQRPA